jgi:thiamine-phosphate diphosphorylase
VSAPLPLPLPLPPPTLPPPALPPRLLVFTDRTQCTRTLPQTVALAVAAGARAVVLRDKDLPTAQRAELAEELAALLGPVHGLLILAGAASVGPDRPETRAVHLSAVDGLPSTRPALIGRSCHNHAEVRAAVAQGCHYVTVSPVFPTTSKPGYGPALGLANLATLCRAAPPGYALGGVSVADVAGCVNAGARGVAVMGAIMRDPHLAAAYLAALAEVAE